MFMADGAVRPAFPLGPTSRFTPNAAQSKLESTCGGSFASPKLRMVCLAASASIRGMPPVFWGGGSATGCNSWAMTETAQRSKLNKTEGHDPENLRFMFFSFILKMEFFRVREIPGPDMNHLQL
jgi:hypothetical protein